ncbi:MAG TPA: YihY/virulence factor BrkB family protein [Bacteroidales bacterium]|nr:YihY/virulence factor BrkB family protein [Bacteroidales bacterium]
MVKKIKGIGNQIRQLVQFLEKGIWQISLHNLPRRKSWIIRQIRVILLALRGFNEDNVGLRASSLTFFTLLSLVPVVGLGFGIAKGFGLEMYLEQQLAVALAGHEEVMKWVLSFSQSLLQRASGGMVAGLGIMILLFTVFMVMKNIEEAFNDIWQVKKSRHWTRMLSDYFAIMFIAPLFIILSSAATVFLNTQVHQLTTEFEFFGFWSPVLFFLVNLIPYVLIWVIFTIVYMAMPNTNVKFSSAVLSGITAGTLFQLAQWGYINFQIGVSAYNAIYGSFAALPLLLLWLQISWFIVLFGAELAFANQNVENYEFDKETQNISPFNKKLLSIYVMYNLVQYFLRGKPAPDSEKIAIELEIPNKLVRSILNDLVEVGLANEVQTHKAKQSAYQPALDINQISIQMIIERLDKKGMDFLVAKNTEVFQSLKNSLDSFRNNLANSEKNLLLRDLATSEPVTN